jgi:hypothetical protein
MSTGSDSGSQFEDHQGAAELHELAAHTHRSAAVAHDKRDRETGQELSSQALECSEIAYQHTEDVQRETVNQHGFGIFGRGDVAAQAHKLWRARSCPEGSPAEDSFHAAHELRARTSGPRE